MCVTSKCRATLLLLLAVTLCGCGLFKSPGPAAGPPPAETVQLPTVLFVVLPQSEGRGGEPLERPALVPLACYGRGAMEAGQRCLAFAEEGAMLKLEGGEPVVPSGRTRPHCPGGMAREVALSLPGPVSAGFAVWPADRLGAVVVPTQGKPWEPSTCQGWCSFLRAGHPRVRVDAGQMARLGAASRAAGLPPDTGLEVLQAYSMDQDGDGKPERFYAVAALDEEEEEYAFLFSALIMEPGTGRGRPVLIWRDDRNAVVLRGAMDLDGDGSRELWLLLTPTSGGGVAHEMVLVSQGRAAPMGGYRCVAR